MKTLAQLAIFASNADNVKAGLLYLLDLLPNKAHNDLVTLILNDPEESFPTEVTHKSKGILHFSNLLIKSYGIEVEYTYTKVGDYWFRDQKEADEAIANHSTCCSRTEETETHTVKATVVSEHSGTIDLNQWLEMNKA